jgi:sugar phosphate permease
MSDAVSNASPPSLATPRSLRVRLCVMMFLQYFVQGCYLPIVSVYLRDALGFSTGQIGVFGSALAAGPLLAPFVLGQLVDRRYATQHVLAVSHLTAGVIMLLL